jgi:hypothetical protein
MRHEAARIGTVLLAEQEIRAADSDHVVGAITAGAVGQWFIHRAIVGEAIAPPTPLGILAGGAVEKVLELIRHILFVGGHITRCLRSSVNGTAHSPVICAEMSFRHSDRGIGRHTGPVACWVGDALVCHKAATSLAAPGQRLAE